jgi:hypothetical protein
MYFASFEQEGNVLLAQGVAQGDHFLTACS